MNFSNSIQKKVPTDPEDCEGLGGVWHGDKCSEQAMDAHKKNREALDIFSNKINQSNQQLKNYDNTKIPIFEPADNETLCKNETYMNDISIKCGFFDNKCNENKKTKNKIYEKCLQDKNNETQLKNAFDETDEIIKSLQGGKRKKTKRRKRRTKKRRSRKRV